jgi:hypothetical protein
MKKTTIGKLKDGASLFLSTRKKAVRWVLQTFEGSTAVITAEISKITRVLPKKTVCYLPK